MTRAKITSYCTGWITASKTTPREGDVAANPPWHLGSWAHVAGAWRHITDRIGDGDPNHFDLFTKHCAHAISWGIHYGWVYR